MCVWFTVVFISLFSTLLLPGGKRLQTAVLIVSMWPRAHPWCLLLESPVGENIKNQIVTDTRFLTFSTTTGIKVWSSNRLENMFCFLKYCSSVVSHQPPECSFKQWGESGCDRLFRQEEVEPQPSAGGDVLLAGGSRSWQDRIMPGPLAALLLNYMTRNLFFFVPFVTI